MSHSLASQNKNSQHSPSTSFSKGKVLRIKSKKSNASTPEISGSASAGFFDIDETLEQMQTGLKMATDFIKRRPLLVLATAGAVGALAAWALSLRKKSNRRQSLKKAA